MTRAPGGGSGPISGPKSRGSMPMSRPAVRRQEAADHLAAFRYRTAGRGGPPATEMLAEARAKRLRTLAGGDTGLGRDA